MDKNVVGQRKLRQELNSIHFLGLKGIKVGDALAMELVHFAEWTKEDISNMEFLEIREYSYEQTCKNPETASTHPLRILFISSAFQSKCRR